MNEPTEHLRRLARLIVDEATARLRVRAALLTGSAARGNADVFSDIDLLLYTDELPAPDVMNEAYQALGATQPVRRKATEYARSEEFELCEVHVGVTLARHDWMDRRLDEVLTRIEEFDSPSQKILSGVLEGLPLHGEELLARWKERVRRYPDHLRRAVIERHWKFFPLWYYEDAIRVRDAELWRLDLLLDSAFDILAILGALNRVYVTRFQLKRMRSLIEKMPLTPPRVADRLESLPHLESASASLELARLIAESRALIRSEMPDLDLPIAFSLDTRIQPWNSARR